MKTTKYPSSIKLSKEKLQEDKPVEITTEHIEAINKWLMPQKDLFKSFEDIANSTVQLDIIITSTLKRVDTLKEWVYRLDDSNNSTKGFVCLLCIVVTINAAIQLVGLFLKQ